MLKKGKSSKTSLNSVNSEIASECILKRFKKKRKNKKTKNKLSIIKRKM